MPPSPPKWHAMCFWLKSAGPACTLHEDVAEWLNSLPKCEIIVAHEIGMTGALIIVRET